MSSISTTGNADLVPFFPGTLLCPNNKKISLTKSQKNVLFFFPSRLNIMDSRRCLIVSVEKEIFKAVGNVYRRTSGQKKNSLHITHITLCHHLLLKCIYFSPNLPPFTSIYLQSYSKNATTRIIYLYESKQEKYEFLHLDLQKVITIRLFSLDYV